MPIAHTPNALHRLQEAADRARPHATTEEIRDLIDAVEKAAGFLYRLELRVQALEQGIKYTPPD